MTYTHIIDGVLMTRADVDRWLSARYEAIGDQMMRDGQVQRDYSGEQGQQSFKNAKTFYEIAQKILREIAAD